MTMGAPPAVLIKSPMSSGFVRILSPVVQYPAGKQLQERSLSQGTCNRHRFVQREYVHHFKLAHNGCTIESYRAPIRGITASNPDNASPGSESWAGEKVMFM